MLKRQRWLEAAGGAQHQRQKHCSCWRQEEETGDEKGESICLVGGWKLKEQKRQKNKVGTQEGTKPRQSGTEEKEP